MLAAPLGWRVAFVMGAVAAAIGLLAIVFFTRASSAASAVGLTSTESSQQVGWLDLRAGGKVLLASYLATFGVFYCRNGMLNAVVPVLGAERATDLAQRLWTIADAADVSPLVELAAKPA